MALYADITQIGLVGVPQAGSIVYVNVTIKNLHTSTAGIMVGAALEYGVSPWPTLTFDPYYANFPPGVSYYFSSQFTVPSLPPGTVVKIHAYSYYYGVDGSWHFDDEEVKSFTIEAGGPTPPSYTGVITKKEIDLGGGVRVGIPASGVAQGSSILVRVTGKNTTTTTQRMGIGWTITDPDGVVRESYGTWEAVPYTGAGGEKEFLGGRFTYDKIGAWRINVELRMNYDSPVVIDSYNGILCTVIQAVILTGLRSTIVNTTYGTYDYGASVPYVLEYEYKGEAQAGSLKVELGTGAYPLFSPQAVIGPVAYSFAKRVEYTRIIENRSFILPSTLVRGQTYSVRVTLTTNDGVSDNDIDYTALKVLGDAVPSTDLQGLVITPTYRDYALGETYTFSISYKYKGIAQSGTSQVAIKTLTTTVHTYPQEPMQYDRADTLTPLTKQVSVTLPKTLTPGQVYSIYMRIDTADGKDTSDTKGSAFRITPTEEPEDPGVGTYRLVKDHLYPYGETYKGNAQEVTAEFSVAIADLPGTNWISERVVNAFQDSVAKYGAHMLHLKVYERDERLLAKGYKVIIYSTPPKEPAGQEYTPRGIVNLRYLEPALGPAAWAIIIIAALALVAIIISMLVPTVKDMVWGEEGIVPTIIQMIQMVMMVMMLSLVMEQMREVGEPKPITEAIERGVRGAPKAVKKVIEYFKPEVD